MTLTFDLESGVLVTCHVGYLCENFGLARSLCSRLRPDVRDRQTSDTILNAPAHYGWGIITITVTKRAFTRTHVTNNDKSNHNAISPASIGGAQ